MTPPAPPNAPQRPRTPAPTTYRPDTSHAAPRATQRPTWVTALPRRTLAALVMAALGYALVRGWQYFDPNPTDALSALPELILTTWLFWITWDRQTLREELDQAIDDNDRTARTVADILDHLADDYPNTIPTHIAATTPAGRHRAH